MSDPRWMVLERAQPELLCRFAGRGVVRVEFVAAFPDLAGVAVWLCTESDRQRDAMPPSDPYIEEVLEILRSVGLREADLAESSTVAQSQETVDRDHQGSWFYALR